MAIKSQPLRTAYSIASPPTATPQSPCAFRFLPCPAASQVVPCNSKDRNKPGTKHQELPPKVVSHSSRPPAPPSPRLPCVIAPLRLGVEHHATQNKCRKYLRGSASTVVSCGPVHPIASSGWRFEGNRSGRCSHREPARRILGITQSTNHGVVAAQTNGSKNEPAPANVP